MSLDNERKIYNLQQLKQQLLKLDLEPKDHLVINEFNPMKGNIYGLFGADNSFIFVKKNSCLEFNYGLSAFEILEYIFSIIVGGEPLISKRYYLIDFFSRTIMSDTDKEDYKDGDLYEYNNIDYYVVLLSKIVPASFLHNISLENVGIIQDKINEFLAENPNFVKQLFFEEQPLTENKSKNGTVKKLISTKQ